MRLQRNRCVNLSASQQRYMGKRRPAQPRATVSQRQPPSAALPKSIKRAEQRSSAAAKRGEVHSKPVTRVPCERHGNKCTWDYAAGHWIDSDGGQHLVERNRKRAAERGDRARVKQAACALPTVYTVYKATCGCRESAFTRHCRGSCLQTSPTT